MTRAIFATLTLAAFGLFLAWAGDNLAGPRLDPIAQMIRDAQQTEHQAD